MTGTCFLKKGNTFFVSTREAMNLHDTLPSGNYVLKVDQFGNFFLEKADAFEIRHKLYGETTRHADRILSTFRDRPAATGVMLAGEKGSGKTLLTRQICIDAAKDGIPTIIINSQFAGDAFNTFIQQIEQPCVILFDEFEKVYDTDHQPHILTLLDGVFPSKKLFLLTCNDKWRVDTHMRNRPGRIYYMLDFVGLSPEFIVEYCEDNLKNKSHIETLTKVAMMFDKFNFDMLKAIVEEMNRYDETPQQVLKILNTKPEFGGAVLFDVTLQVDGIDITGDQLETTIWKGNPITAGNIQVYYYGKKDLDEESYECASFEHQDIKQIEGGQEKIILVNKEGQRAVLTRQKEKYYSYPDM